MDVNAKQFKKLKKFFSKLLNQKIIISLFDYSGTWPFYYSKAGFEVLQVDLKLGTDIFDFQYRRISKELVFGILAAPPCTDFTNSGAQYWAEKDRNGDTERSILRVKKTLEIVRYFDPVFWALENPIGRLSNLVPELGAPWYFQPYEFGNRWSKKTVVWGKFNKPKIRSVKPIQFSKQGSWTQLLGGSAERTKELRSITPLGFAKAFYSANHRVVKSKSEKMKKYEHREFMKINGLKKNSFSEPLQNKIAVFENMCANLKDTIGVDRDELKDLINEVDTELLDEMEEEYAEQLEHNKIDSNDEDILESLFKKGERKILMSELQNLGFKSDLLNSKVIVAGEYFLERISAFKFLFSINKATDG